MQSAFATTDTIGDMSSTRGSDGSGISVQKIVASASGTLSTLGINVQNVGIATASVIGIYADNGLGTAPSGAALSFADCPVAVGWTDVAVPPIDITAGTTYWLTAQPNAMYTTYCVVTGNDPYMIHAYDGTLPAFTVHGTAGDMMNMRMTYSAPAGGWLDTSYNYRYEIKSTAASASQVIAVEFGPHLLWTKNPNAADGGTRWLYCRVSGCGDGQFIVGNETHEVPWELDDGTGHHPQEVWETSAVRIFHMPFQASYNILYDSSQNRIDGTLNGAEVNKPGVFDGAFEFNGGQGDITNVPALSSAYTVSFWAYPYEIGCAEGSWHTGVVLYLYNGFLTAMDNPGSGCQWEIAMHTSDGWKTIFAPIGSSVANKWVHYTGRWDGTTMSLWLNGTLITQIAAPSNTAVDTYDNIGKHAGYPQSVFNGILDEVRIYNRALSDAEIRDLYYDGLGILTSLGQEETYAGPVDLLARIEALETRVSELENNTAGVPELENRTTELETRMTESENRTTVLEGAVSSLSGAVSALGSAVDGLATSLNDFINSITGYLSYLPRALRKDMVCGYMIARNETSDTAFRLSCHMDFTDPDRPRCVCVGV